MVQRMKLLIMIVVDNKRPSIRGVDVACRLPNINKQSRKYSRRRMDCNVHEKALPRECCLRSIKSFISPSACAPIVPALVSINMVSAPATVVAMKPPPPGLSVALRQKYADGRPISQRMLVPSDLPSAPTARKVKKVAPNNTNLQIPVASSSGARPASGNAALDDESDGASSVSQKRKRGDEDEDEDDEDMGDGIVAFRDKGKERERLSPARDRPAAALALAVDQVIGLVGPRAEVRPVNILTSLVLITGGLLSPSLSLRL